MVDDGNDFFFILIMTRKSSPKCIKTHHWFQMKSSLPCWVHASSSGTEPQPQTCKSWPVPQPSCTQQGPTVALRSQITVHEARRTWNPLANSTHLLLHPVTDFLFLLGPKCTALFLWDFMELLEIILTVREVCICLSELSCSQWDAIGIWVLLLERTKVKRGNTVKTWSYLHGRGFLWHNNIPS